MRIEKIFVLHVWFNRAYARSKSFRKSVRVGVMSRTYGLPRRLFSGWLGISDSDQNIMRRRGKSRSWSRVMNGRTFASERLRKNKFWSTRASGR